jgi:glutamate/tyrosine decarboxylase-like PLP-dependent enzyme
MPTTDSRTAPLAMDAVTFRTIGHELVDQIAALLDGIPAGPVTRDRTPAAVREGLGLLGPLPEHGTEPAALLRETAQRLFAESLFNAHPRFFGYITAPPSPIGVFGDFLASALNANCGSWTLAPAASEIEAQTVRWIGEFIGFPAGDGLLVSGGNMANMVCLIAARAAAATWDIRAAGAAGGPQPLVAYASTETHTWIQKAADICGLGTNAIRWIDTGPDQRLDPAALRRAIDSDAAAGRLPFLVVGTAGSVSTGAIDPLGDIAALCREKRIWFHVDGAYGAFAAALPNAPGDLRAIGQADSVAVDPHKWLYAPLEAGCALVRNREALRLAFSYHPPYYHFDEQALNFVDRGPQNSRGFRALKVWLALRHAGAAGDRAAGRARAGHAVAQHHHVPLPASRSARLRRSIDRRIPEPAECDTARRTAAGRRDLRVERGHRRTLRAARLHREFPHNRRRRGGRPGRRRRAWAAPRPGTAGVTDAALVTGRCGRCRRWSASRRRGRCSTRSRSARQVCRGSDRRQGGC